MNRMETEQLRERVARVLFFVGLEDDGADPGPYWRERADEVLAALGLDDFDAAVMRAIEAYHSTELKIGTSRMGEALRAALTATDAGGVSSAEPSGTEPNNATSGSSHDEGFFDDPDLGGPTVGYCSKCGEARDSFYTCRDGGETNPKSHESSERG